MTAPTTPERIWSRIEKTATCWLWTGGKNAGGYGTVKIHGKTMQVHRVVYEWLVGPIPEGLVLDHLKDRCGNKNCCNPDHLEPVSFLENLRRGPHANRDRTHCTRGHEFTEENTAWTTAHKRLCRKCHALRSQKAREKQRERKSTHG